MNRNDDLDAAELEEQRYAQASRRNADYGDCDPVQAELLAANTLDERIRQIVAERLSRG
ncbi:hypothetical protein [Streptomyces sp. SAS_276]|uniref:hypothetical protein n=1 Tax=Streptomyces sp. SAS_276 TaxID=3412745 RepID=UPI00403C1F26